MEQGPGPVPRAGCPVRRVLTSALRLFCLPSSRCATGARDPDVSGGEMCVDLERGPVMAQTSEFHTTEPDRGPFSLQINGNDAAVLDHPSRAPNYPELGSVRLE